MKTWRLYFQTKLSEYRKYLMKDFRRPLTISHGPSTSIVAWIVRNYIAESSMVQGKIDAQQPPRTLCAATFLCLYRPAQWCRHDHVLLIRERYFSVGPRGRATIVLLIVSIRSVLQIWNTYYYAFRKNYKINNERMMKNYEELHMRWKKDFGLS